MNTDENHDEENNEEEFDEEDKQLRKKGRHEVTHQPLDPNDYPVINPDTRKVSAAPLRLRCFFTFKTQLPRVTVVSE